MSSTVPQSTGSLTPMSHSMASVQGNSKCEAPLELDPDSQVHSSLLESDSPKVSMMSLGIMVLSTTELLLPRGKRSAMDSRSARLLSSVEESCSTFTFCCMCLCDAVGPTVLPSKKLVVRGSITVDEAGAVATRELTTDDVVVVKAAAELADSKKLVTTSGSVCRMTSGGF